ncbi:hypothetical protein RKD37_000383 [Streptomyces ambofaciens]
MHHHRPQHRTLRNDPVVRAVIHQARTSHHKRRGHIP